MEKYLYFREVADEDNDDGEAGGGAGHLTSLMIPASRFRGVVPGGSTSTIKMYFDSVRNYQGDAAEADENTVADYVILTVTAGKIREAMTDILRAINGSRPTQGGFLVIADDVTTNVAGETVSAEYVSKHITGIGVNSIEVEVAHTGS